MVTVAFTKINYSQHTLTVVIAADNTTTSVMLSQEVKMGNILMQYDQILNDALRMFAIIIIMKNFSKSRIIIIIILLMQYLDKVNIIKGKSNIIAIVVLRIAKISSINITATVIITVIIAAVGITMFTEIAALTLITLIVR